MMLHDYKCPNCQSIEEHDHKFNVKPEIKCLKCGTTMMKMIGSAGFKLVGEGFYKQGYKGK